MEMQTPTGADALFRQFHPGPVNFAKGYWSTWIGSLVRCEFSSVFPYQVSPFTPPSIPRFGEDFFEWQTLLEAAEGARDSFCFVELGAGFGRWSGAAAIAARKRNIDIRLISVEAEPNHFRMLRQHLLDNGIDPEKHRLIESAISNQDGPVYFTVGHSTDWWGQAILPSRDCGFGNWDRAEVVSLPGVSLAKALDGIGTVDLIDMDIQGAEADVIESSLPILRNRVRRLYIGTHSAEVEGRIRAALSGSDWLPIFDFRCGEVANAESGSFTFGDGVQTWINPALTSNGEKTMATRSSLRRGIT